MNEMNVETAIVKAAQAWLRKTLDSGKAINDGNDSELLYHIDNLCRESGLDTWDEAVLGCRVLEEMPEISIKWTDRVPGSDLGPDLVYIGYKDRDYEPVYEDRELIEVVEVGREHDVI